MKASQVAEAISTNGFEFGLTGAEEVITHSRGAAWVARKADGVYITVTLTEGGNHVVAVTDSKFGGQKAPKAPKSGWTEGYIKIGRNVIRAFRDEDGNVERLSNGYRVVYTGTAKFVAV